MPLLDASDKGRRIAKLITITLAEREGMLEVVQAVDGVEVARETVTRIAGLEAFLRTGNRIGLQLPIWRDH